VSISDLNITTCAVNNLEHNCHRMAFPRPKKCKSVRIIELVLGLSVLCRHISFLLEEIKHIVM
jgi:hypothetical protein